MLKILRKLQKERPKGEVDHWGKNMKKEFVQFFV